MCPSLTEKLLSIRISTKNYKFVFMLRGFVLIGVATKVGIFDSLRNPEGKSRSSFGTSKDDDGEEFRQKEKAMTSTHSAYYLP